MEREEVELRGKNEVEEKLVTHTLTQRKRGEGRRGFTYVKLELIEDLIS